MTKNRVIWEREYKEKKLMSGTEVPRSLVKFFKFLKKQWKKDGVYCELDQKKILDLGAGEGKNSIYVAERGAKVYGIEIAHNAVQTAKSKLAALDATFLNGSIGEPFEFDNDYFDVVLDVTSSNSLTEKERDIYIREVFRVLKRGGYFFVRVPARDAHAKTLIKKYPGSEKNTYIIPEFGLEEHVFSKNEFEDFYAEFFDVKNIELETHYTNFNERKYKRDFLIGYFLKT